MTAHSAFLELASSDSVLVEGFRWAKRQARDYVFHGDPVGDWYEAALPGRQAFCMRDVAHQSEGAAALGLWSQNRNMLWKFAKNTSPSRDWCSYWEIDRRDLPCPADYRDDAHFWYNLPANFDVLTACWRQYLWTADRAYLDDPAFRFYYDATIDKYVRRWDKDGDGIPEYYPAYGYRGLSSYDETELTETALVAGDLVALQYTAYLAFAEIMDLQGNAPRARAARENASALRVRYNQEWWDAGARRFHSHIRQDRTFAFDRVEIARIMPLLCEITDAGEKTERTLDAIEHMEDQGVETRSYLPGTLYLYGRNEAAYAELRTRMDPGLPRREYPEVAYAVVGDIVTGLMGVSVDARDRSVTTLPRLTAETGWAEISRLPLLNNTVDIRHQGAAHSVCTNTQGPAFYWKAMVSGRHEYLVVDGRKMYAENGVLVNGQPVSHVCVRMEPSVRRAVTSE